MKKAITILSILATVCLNALGAVDYGKLYVDEYSSLAVSEMYRSGVPASITLAQGMLESGNGRGTLAVRGNNHFGIKCHSDWTGERIYHDDDSRGECFRKYPSPSFSFRDHSDFLRYKSRYAFLFELDPKDYKGWAFGLKKAGYATDPRYAVKLIEIIEKYELNRFDNMERADSVLPQSPVQIARPVRFKGTGRRGTFAVYLGREVMQFNGTPFIYAREGETYRTIAVSYNLFPGELARYNDSRDSGKPLLSGEVVYLQRKASKAPKGLDKYICVEGERLRDIAQKYGIRLKSLMKMNGIKDVDRYLAEDETLILR